MGTHDPRRPRSRSCLTLSIAFLLWLTAGAPHASALDDHSWALTGFGGRLTDGSWPSLVYRWRETRIAHASLYGLGLTRVLRRHGGLEFELEGQVVKYFGDQTNWEFNVPLVARWSRFPWTDALHTSAAFGLGLSWAASTPEYETENKGGSEQLLAYWTIEFEAGPPRSVWSGVFRLHHRSPAFGVFGPEGGSNSLVVGVRRRF